VQSFDLVIKLYPKGQMSRYLKGLAVGDVVKFRGPGPRLDHNLLCLFPDLSWII
jgi:hypothetical protein